MSKDLTSLNERVRLKDTFTVPVFGTHAPFPEDWANLPKRLYVLGVYTELKNGSLLGDNHLWCTACEHCRGKLDAKKEAAFSFKYLFVYPFVLFNALRMRRVTVRECHSPCTPGPAYNEFGYKEHPVVASRFLYIKFIDCNVIKFIYNEHPPITSSFFCIFLLL